jgi:hypothetical protein
MTAKQAIDGPGSAGLSAKVSRLSTMSDKAPGLCAKQSGDDGFSCHVAVVANDGIGFAVS